MSFLWTNQSAVKANLQREASCLQRDLSRCTPDSGVLESRWCSAGATHSQPGLCCVLSHVQLFATPWTVAQPGSSIHRILQARVLEWVASTPGESFQPRMEPSSPVLPALQAGPLLLSYWGSSSAWAAQSQIPGLAQLCPPARYSGLSFPICKMRILGPISVDLEL